MSGICGISSSTFRGEKCSYALYGCFGGALVLAIITGAMYMSGMKWLSPDRVAQMMPPLKNACRITTIVAVVLFGAIMIKKCACKETNPMPVIDDEDLLGDDKDEVKTK